MTIGQDRRGIGVFSTKQDAELALNALRDSGFPMDTVSMIAKDDGDESTRGTDLNKKPGHEVVKGAEVGAFTGTVFGLLAGLVVGMSTLTIPGIGTVVVAGTILETLATTLAGAGVLDGLGFVELGSRFIDLSLSLSERLLRNLVGLFGVRSARRQSHDCETG